MISATDVCSVEPETSSSRSRSWKARWFQRPVSGSVCACRSSVARMCALSIASAAASPKRTTSRNSSSVNSWKPER